MQLQDIGIYPASFREATHAAHIRARRCTIIVPCRSREEAERVKQIGNAFFAETDEPEEDLIA